MIKSLLVLRIAGQNPHLFHHDVKQAVNAILDRIVSAMARRDRVELRDFGTFVVKVRKARVGHNPPKMIGRVGPKQRCLGIVGCPVVCYFLQ